MSNKLVPCHVCKEMIAESAHRCPKCGAARAGGDGKKVMKGEEHGCLFALAFIISSSYAIAKLFFT